MPISVEFPAGIDTTNSVDNTHWTHIFFSITHGSTSNYVELYVDSKLISGAHVDREVTTTIGRLKQDVLIGIERIDRDTNNGQFAGKIDEVLIFQGVSHNVIALTASEVDELYNDRNQIFNPIGYFSRDNSVIWQHTNDYEIGYWKFNEGSGDTTNDDSAYNSPTTIHGALWQTNK